MKWILILLAALGIAWSSGYRLHPENIQYYLQIENSGGKSEIKLTNGSIVTGTIEGESDRDVTLNTDGVRMTYKKSEIESMKTGLAPQVFEMFKKNYEKNHQTHPVLTHRKEDTLKAKWDYAVLEPSRIAEDIKKKNPSFSPTQQLEQAMAANARARQEAYKKRVEMEKIAQEDAAG